MARMGMKINEPGNDVRINLDRKKKTPEGNLLPVFHCVFVYFASPPKRATLLAMMLKPNP